MAKEGIRLTPVSDGGFLATDGDPICLHGIKCNFLEFELEDGISWMWCNYIDRLIFSQLYETGRCPLEKWSIVQLTGIIEISIK